MSLVDSHNTSARANTSKQIVSTPNAPKAIGPYSQGTKCGGTLYVTGCVGVDPKTNKFVAGTVEAQTKKALENMTAVVEAGGSSLKNVMKCTVFLRDMDDFQRMNKVYATFFPPGTAPARSTVAVLGLPMNALVEIECIAAVPLVSKL